MDSLLGLLFLCLVAFSIYLALTKPSSKLDSPKDLPDERDAPQPELVDDLIGVADRDPGVGGRRSNDQHASQPLSVLKATKDPGGSLGGHSMRTPRTASSEECHHGRPSLKCNQCRLERHRFQNSDWTSD